MVIPDTQVKPDVDLSFLSWIGQYAVDKKPDKIIMIGDFADMHSLSSYDQGKKSFEGRRYKDDIAAVHSGLELLFTPMWEYNIKAKKNHEPRYKPKLYLTLGNHEDRITRAVESDAKLDGTIGLADLGYESFGFTVYPYLEVVVLDGIAYSHFFTSGVAGRAVPNARQLIMKKHMSATMGHNQNWDIHREVRADGKPILGLFAGACYLHEEEYLGPQGNTYDRGIWMKHEVDDGVYHPMYVSLNFLKDKYGTKSASSEKVV